MISAHVFSAPPTAPAKVPSRNPARRPKRPMNKEAAGAVNIDTSTVMEIGKVASDWSLAR